jgi:hypothetical protein
MHKLLIFGDSIPRGSAETERTLISEKYNVFSVIKPGANLPPIFISGAARGYSALIGCYIRCADWPLYSGL